METVSTYFTRRAGEERANAAAADSPDARRAHLELAVRLVRVATEPALGNAWSGEAAIPLGKVLAVAFPLPDRGSFEALLEAISETDPT